MATTNARLAESRPRPAEPLLREVIEALEGIEREAGSPGERQAAEWIGARLERAGAEVTIDEVPYQHGFAGMLGRLAAGVAAVGATAAATGKLRRVGALAGAGALALIADDISNGLRPWRRAVMETRMTTNVVAELGDPGAERTLVILGHHDAAHTGRIFDPTAQRLLGEGIPGVVERIDTSIPQWWGLLAGPALVAVGSASGRRKLAAAGAALSAVGAALMEDIERGEIVPGASDNLTSIAAMVAFAEALRERPIEGLRIVFASCGAEEVLQGGIYGFCKDRLAAMDREHTWVLNLDTLGSPQLVLLEGEGPIVMEDFFDIGFRDLIARVADRERIPMRRGMRSRNSTDSVIPSRMRYPTACLVSVNRYKALDHYHLPSDTSENVAYPTVAAATDLVEAVARELATG